MSQHTLFYLEPPYHSNENDYVKGIFTRDDFACIAEMLGNFSGRFIMSINDKPAIRELYKQFNITEAKTTYTVSRSQNKKVTELLITNS